MRKIEAIQRSIIMLNAMLFGAWPFLLKAAVTSALGSLEGCSNATEPLMVSRH